MRKMIIRSLLLTAAVSSTLALAQEKAPEAANAQQSLPVKNVVLFSSGVGYFEHFGPVKGNGTTELRFKTSQINDILKSLVLQDMDGGKVSTVQYPSQDPIEKTLASFQVDISQNPTLAQLINQLRGAKVILSVGAEKYEGTILGAEPRQVQIKPDTPAVEVWFVNVLKGASIKQIELSRVTDLQLQDPTLQEELAKALGALATARDQDKKSVVINFTGEGERRIKLGYVVEAAVWKTSYRLVMGDDAGAKPDHAGDKPAEKPADKPADDAGKSTLQGWAIVENQTDNDWTDVQLNLVSGRPISFVMNLYQPLYVPRPLVEMELYQSLRPQTYDGGMNDDKDALKDARRNQGRGGGAFAGAPPAAPMADEQMEKAQNQALGRKQESRASQLDPTASVESVASAAKLGELFQYSVGNVSLPRQKSAMIPIVSDKVAVEKVSIYNQKVLQKHPLNGAEVVNGTGKHLLQGPITVFEAGSYAGDAQIDNVPPGEKRLLSYGIDLQVAVQTRPENTTQVVTGKIVQGVLQLTRKSQQSLTYVLDSKSDRDKSVIIEHPISESWKLVNTPDPAEKTQALYRFKLPVPKGTQKSLTVREENVHLQQIALLPADINSLMVYARTGEIPEEVRKTLTEAINRKQAMVVLERKINEGQQEIAKITQEQNRIRENMRTVDKASQYYNRLLTKLNEQETQIEGLQKENEDLRTKLDAARKSFEDYLNGLNVG